MTLKQKNAAITLLWMTLALFILAGDYWINKRWQPVRGIETATKPVPATATAEPIALETHTPSVPIRPVQVDLEKMVYVPGGDLVDGSSVGGQADILADFYIDRNAVTVTEYAIFLNDFARLTWDCSGYDCLNMYHSVANVRAGLTVEAGQFRVEQRFAGQPITSVDKRTAQAYCQWTGKHLPTPVEWQHVSRNLFSVESGLSTGKIMDQSLRCTYTPQD